MIHRDSTSHRVAVYQQIVGRGSRLAPGKTDCLILDYAGNPHDLYAPEVCSPKGKAITSLSVFCPACGFANTFWGKPHCRRHAD
ncbi:hypothetical protein KCP75_11455 [Salmonella enterica subsp. enterica]|nr:hypothetical protein KCP75_11455 [Salmonella enterica subsp. enterica]